MESIAIVGLACRYPEADSPDALWQMALAQRRAFRRIPSARLPLDQYGGDASAPDLTYGTQAAVLTNWSFDRSRFRVAKATYDTVDPSHWLALECAGRALCDAGFDSGSGLPKATTAVIVGNSLTGDYSRAAALRLRWPYVRRTVKAALDDAGVEADRAAEILATAERRFKQPLPDVNAETLAGWLSNTIAGRICNHFDFGGGGYVVDGACSSSLLAVTTACDALLARSADTVLAGGVDLSLDPLELVGFAKAQALATSEMLVYDRDACGFTPGEGCGFVLLMREADARARGCRIYACIRGWGVASDGRGGITRPEVDGQRRALQRAYRAAGFSIDTVAYFEGHGTGTPVGDATEIAALTEERRCAGATSPATIGSIKANIGHTKAAAGIAGFIKATLALHSGILPPTTGCRTPSALLLTEGAHLRVERGGRPWPSTSPLRASVSAMGFGGINTHVALEATAATGRRTRLSPGELACLRTVQDVEVFPLAADTAADMLPLVRTLQQRAPGMSRGELTDAAVALQQRYADGALRAAMIAATPEQLESACGVLAGWLDEGREAAAATRTDVFLGSRQRVPRIGLLFPGQASPSHRSGGLWRRRFSVVAELYGSIDEAQPDRADTCVAQPAIVRASVAGLRMLERLGIHASVAMGHSLGELCALQWGGAFDEATLLRIVGARGAAMAAHGAPDGGMASVEAAPDTVSPFLDGEEVVIAGLNGARQTVLAGRTDSLQRLADRLRAHRIAVHRLAVSHAFHSPAMTRAADAFSAALDLERLQAPSRPVISTITGRAWSPGGDPRTLLVRQLTSPVRFSDALACLVPEVDLLIETGPGRVLSGLVTTNSSVPVVALDAGSESVRGLLEAAAAAFTAGADVRWAELARDRYARPFDIASEPQVLVSPCEASRTEEHMPATTAAASRTPEAAGCEARPQESPAQIARRVVAARAELPLEAVHHQHRLLSDLHLNSITATQVIVDLARTLRVALPMHPIEYIDASIEAIVGALQSAGHQVERLEPAQPAGVRPWLRTFQVRWYEEARPSAAARRDGPAAPLTIVGSDSDPVVAELRRAAADAGLSGTVVCLPARVGTGDVAGLIAAALAALVSNAPFIVVQREGGGSALARSLWLEGPERDVLVANLHGDPAESVRMLIEELRELRGFAEVRLGGGRREVPYAVHVDWPEPDSTPFRPDDVLLVTGGGKGIVAECALALAARFGVRLGILGRSTPSTDRGLAANLERFAARRLPVRYVSCDVVDPDSVRSAVRSIENDLGPITAVLHGAGVNEPALLRDLTDETIARTLEIKVEGLTHVLNSIDPSRLRLCIGFGSLTARTGLRGDSHYAAANELLVREIARWSSRHPDCRCLALEWSVWAGTGMGERLGRLAALERAGITPLTIEQGTALLCRLVAAPDARGSFIATARFPQSPTLRIAGGEPPTWRFLERPVAWYPGIELIADADLSRSSDLYLDDHVVHGERVFPGVFGLEAMAQAAAALLDPGPELDVEFTDVAFSRPIVVPASGVRRIRTAAVREGDSADVAVRSDESTFSVDHMRARVRFLPAAWRRERGHGAPSAAADTSVDAAPLYDHLFFQRGRFRRIASYSELQSTRCRADIAPSKPERWFSAFLPDTLLLGNPGTRDALMHAIQPCVPELTLLPTAVNRILVGRGANPHHVSASERSSDGRSFVYDVSAADGHGECERWEGLCLRALGPANSREPWVPALVGPAVERALASIAHSSDVRAFVTTTPAVAQASGHAAAANLIGRRIDRRPDGQALFSDDGDGLLSIAHDGGIALVVTGSVSALACDLQTSEPRDEDDWLALLGFERMQLARLISNERREPLHTAATRLWCALECLKKAGAALDTRLEPGRDVEGWLALSADGAHILTREFALVPDRRRVIAAVLCGVRQPAATSTTPAPAEAHV